MLGGMQGERTSGITVIEKGPKLKWSGTGDQKTCKGVPQAHAGIVALKRFHGWQCKAMGQGVSSQ